MVCVTFSAGLRRVQRVGSDGQQGVPRAPEVRYRRRKSPILLVQLALP